MGKSITGTAVCVRPDWIGAKDLPLYRVGFWTCEADNSPGGYLAQDVRAENEWAAVGSVMLHLRATAPNITLQPRGMSVILVEDGRKRSVD